MDMRRLFLALLLMLMSLSCMRLKDIAVTDCRIANVRMLGFSGIECELQLIVDNPAMGFQLVSVSGQLRDGDRPLAIFSSTEPVSVKARSVGEYAIKGTVQTASGVSPFDMLGLLAPSASKDLLIDADLLFRTDCGLKKKFPLRDITVEQLLQLLNRL